MAPLRGASNRGLVGCEELWSHRRMKQFNISTWEAIAKPLRNEVAADVGRRIPLVSHPSASSRRRLRRGFETGLRLLCLFAAVAGLTGCVTNPETGRRQLLLVPESQMTALGLNSFNQMKKEVPISKDAQANQLVQRVGQRIASVVSLAGAQWEFVVFDSKEANAFCLPGGKIGVYTGILPITKDEAGLAAVLGHEVAHATLQHGRERMSEGLAANVFGQLGSAYVDATSPRWTGAFGQLYGIGAQVGVLLPHSRKQESEADRRGLVYMARAGYDPEAAVAFWERFAAVNKQAGGRGTPSFLRTHPLDETRIRQLKEWMPEAKRELRPVR
jgi:predicted Zn-dependent protease